MYGRLSLGLATRSHLGREGVASLRSRACKASIPVRFLMDVFETRSRQVSRAGERS
jgi:hypothetical protein